MGLRLVVAILVCCPICLLYFVNKTHISNIYLLTFVSHIFPLCTCLYLFFGWSDHINGYLGLYDKSEL